MATTILLEGTDGSGKTTIINNFKRYLENSGKKCQVISKDNLPKAKEITAIYNSGEGVDKRTEIALRIAREFTKISSIDSHFDFVIIDRSVISLISTIKIYGLDYNYYIGIIDLLIQAYGEYYTVFCIPPFEIARKRIENRAKETGQKLSKKEAKGFRYNKRIYDILIDLSNNSSITGQGILKLDTSKLDERECLNEMVQYFIETKVK